MFKFFYALFINAVVIFMIYTLMNTITSSGLPGRQAIDLTSFQV